MTAAMEDVPSSATTTAGGSGNDTYQVDATEHPSHRLFQAVVEQDYDSLTRLFAINARNSIVSFMSMKSRWARQQDSMAKSEEKLDEFLQQLSYSDSPGRRLSPLSLARQQDDSSYYHLLQELSNLIARKSGGGIDGSGSSICGGTSMTMATASGGGTTLTVTREADRLMWEASSTLGDSRPPANLCIYNRDDDTSPPSPIPMDDSEGDGDINNNTTAINRNNPPIFDGAVANATPPPLGGSAAGASGGSGTVLHLACALDRPLILAFLLVMGADGRASHTAFRRLMIHEAACNGSIHCLRLLLEMGRKYSVAGETNAKLAKETTTTVPFLPDAMELSASSALGPAVPLIYSRTPPPIGMNMRYFRRGMRPSSSSHSSSSSSSHGGRGKTSHGGRGKSDDERRADFLSVLRQFENCCILVQNGEISELQAARSLLANAPILDTTRMAVIRSCTFQAEADSNRSFLRPYGCADGHGNTPLHWAAFKNEKECVALLLEYSADPNARAHPSGWTPLHDAAYSNSSECIELLVTKGAHVDARANSGATPLCFAAQEDAADAAQLLLDHGADLSARCAGSSQSNHGSQQQLQPQPQQPFQAPINPHSRFSGYTPMHYCAHYNASRASKVLLGHKQAKVSMETPDLSGRLPIHVAVARGSSDVLRALLHAGARVDIRPNEIGGGGGSSRTPSSLPILFGHFPEAPQRRPPAPEEPGTPNRNRSISSTSSTSSSSSSSGTSPVTSPILRSMIPSQPISSSKPWNCLSQKAIDECKTLISKAEQSWRPEHHLLFTPRDRKAIMELLRVGKRLEQSGVIFVDLWPNVLSFCGRGWFDTEDDRKLPAIEGAATTSNGNGMQSEEPSDRLGTESEVYHDNDDGNNSSEDDMDYLSLPTFG